MSRPPASDGELRTLALQALFTENTDPLYVMTPDGRFVAGSPALAARLGVPWDELRDVTFDGVVHPEDRDRVRAEFDAAAAGETRRYSTRGVRPDGSVFHVDVVNTPIYRDGEVLAIAAIAHDVDEHAGRQEILEARLWTALEGIGDPLFFVDRDWRITFANSAAAELLGRADTEVTGISVWQLRAPEPEDERLLREAADTRRRLAHRRFDAVLGRWIEITAFPAGDLLGIAVRDVTEVEEARQRIQDDSRLIRAQSLLLDSSRDAIVMRGLSDVIEYANPAARALLGRGDAGELVGRRLRDVLALDDGTATDIETALGRAGRWEGELRVSRAEEDDRITESVWQRIDDPEGSPEVVFCILTDVTERRRHDEVLLRTQRMESIGTLAGGIAHDLSNVLTPLMLSTQLLAGDEGDPHRLRLLEGMRQTIERGTAMIRQVLTFARGVEGERTIVDIASLAAHFAEFCRDTLPKDIAVHVDVDHDLQVLGDPTQLLQVLMNLATNARDAMPGGGTLRLTAADREGRVVIEVADDGAGMPPEVLSRAFEPFFTTKGIGSGTGLGLPVSQAIARTHGGSLDATSTPGAGTVFRLDLPRAEAPGRPEEAPDGEAAPRLAGLRIVVVDDEDSIVDVASLVIAEAGGVALGTTNARDVRDVLADGRVDVVVTDLVMPGMTGRALLDILAAEHPAIPVVAMSGIPEQGARASRRPNVRATLDKPFTAEQLVAAIRLAAGGA